jgi:hypothetical protein
MASGRLAARQVLAAFAKNDFSQKQLSHYSRDLKRVIGGELKVSAALQSLLRFPALFDRLASRARKDEDLRRKINAMLHEPSARKALLWPGFWWKIFEVSLPTSSAGLQFSHDYSYTKRRIANPAQQQILRGSNFRSIHRRTHRSSNRLHRSAGFVILRYVRHY